VTAARKSKRSILHGDCKDGIKPECAADARFNTEGNSRELHWAGFTGQVVVKFENKDSYQGMPSGMPQKTATGAGFSRWMRAGQIQRLKPFGSAFFAASLKRYPDTNRSSETTPPFA
jgi:hypothetical protein